MKRSSKWLSTPIPFLFVSRVIFAKTQIWSCHIPTFNLSVAFLVFKYSPHSQHGIWALGELSVLVQCCSECPACWSLATAKSVQFPVSSYSSEPSTFLHSPLFHFPNSFYASRFRSHAIFTGASSESLLISDRSVHLLPWNSLSLS